MKLSIQRIYIIMLLSSYVHASEDLEKGIDFFETGEYEQAEILLKPLATDGNGMANYYMGLIYDPIFNIKIFPRKKTRYLHYMNKKRKLTKRYYKNAAFMGNAYALYRLGVYYQRNIFDRGNYSIGVKYLKEASMKLKSLSKHGDWLAKYMLASIHISKNDYQIYFKDAVETLEKESKKGNRQAQFYLGKILSDTQCVSTQCHDKVSAFAWFVVSTVQGSFHAKIHVQAIMEHMSKEELEVGKKLGDNYILRYSIR